ncbi:NAD(P)/FAD-dependent oxidoreductase [Dokdonia sp. Hel_I_53]|uniref:NAD(P)/FAD-dependent oxidoreductase n=1 Tax=Dokdonia sp. Hel_I_53 TaxID=1566287 RepID=UPI0011A4C22D|nr:FAD-dependent oxidoreductase [Dokdonia sp. Hel_I_53]
MELSFWEHNSWFTNIDYTVVGSGIVGLTCALRLRERFPNSKICILEKGVLPQGASTKNAGFACFGSLSEILEDLKSHSEDEVVSLVKKRINGLSKLRKLIGDHTLDYRQYGGYELFQEEDVKLYESCLKEMNSINKLLFPIFNKNVYSIVEDPFCFDNVQPKLIFNELEGQIDTGKMMKALLLKAYKNDIYILNNCTVLDYSEEQNQVIIDTAHFSFVSKKMLIATNGFAKDLHISDVKPARAQVLITEPLKDLRIKGTFHLDQGYYYFRNINNRILLGGGRNLDFKTEETTQIGQTRLVQNELERLLREVILPGKEIKIAYRWSGIMGVGTQKKPVLERLSENVYCGVRLGGMGVAIGSTVGEELANLVD